MTFISPMRNGMQTMQNDRQSLQCCSNSASCGCGPSGSTQTGTGATSPQTSLLPQSGSGLNSSGNGLNTANTQNSKGFGSADEMVSQLFTTMMTMMMSLMMTLIQSLLGGGATENASANAGSNSLRATSAPESSPVSSSPTQSGETSEPHNHSHEEVEETSSSGGTQPIAAGRNPDGSNVRATQTMEDYKQRFGVTNSGIWGDEAHKKRKSDHNTGDAADLGVKSIEQGQQVVDSLIQEAEARGIKYIIFNRKIWSVERKDEGWRPYTGDNPHTSHVHVSFNA